MKRIVQITTLCLLVAVVAFAFIRMGVAGSANASTLVTSSSQTCGSWSIVPSPIPSNSLLSRFSGIAAISGNDEWAVGSYFVNRFQTNTLTEHWNGSRWSIVPSPNPNPGSSITDDELFTVAAVSSNDVWASGRENGRSLIEHWDGTQWNVVPSPEPFSSDSLDAIAVVSSNDVWMVGHQITNNAQDLTLIEHWDGTQWSIVPSPNRGTTGNLLGSVTAVSSNDIWAVGWNFDNSGRQQTLIEHWDGTQWSIIASPNVGKEHDNALSGVTAVSSGDIWAVGGFGAGKFPFVGQTLIEHWNGTKWQIVASPNPEQGDGLASVAAVSASDIWATGDSDPGGLDSPPAFFEHWDGASWQAVSSPATTPQSSLGRIAVVPGTGDVWAVGSMRSAAHPHVIRPLVEFFC